MYICDATETFNASDASRAILIVPKTYINSLDIDSRFSRPEVLMYAEIIGETGSGPDWLDRGETLRAWLRPSIALTPLFSLINPGCLVISRT